MTAPSSNPTSGTFLDRPLPRPVKAIFLVLFALIPLFYFFKQYAQRPDLTQIIQFGEMFEPRLLPEVKSLNPEVHSLGGYDGQFYAQIALDPTLRRPDLQTALDDPGGRMQRPLLPFLAYLMGWGRPAHILFCYALLNLGFWFLILAALVWKLPVATLRSFLILFAILFTMGTLSSLECALTDLPATTLGYLSLIEGEAVAVPLIALAILTKPTMALFLLRYVASCRTKRFWKLGLLLALLALLPFALWQLYLFARFPVRLVAENQIGLPFVAWWHHVATHFGIFCHDPYPRLSQLPWQSASFEFLSALSLAVQALFFFLRPCPGQSGWWVGLGFGVLFFCLGHNPAGDQLTYARSVLPMTLLFNLRLMEMRQCWSFFTLYLAGNLGLLEGLRQTFSFLAS